MWSWKQLWCRLASHPWKMDYMQYDSVCKRIVLCYTCLKCGVKQTQKGT